MAHIIERDLSTPIALPKGYAVNAVLTADDEVRYGWTAPDGCTPGRHYRHLLDACHGAWWDDAHQRQGVTA